MVKNAFKTFAWPGSSNWFFWDSGNGEEVLATAIRRFSITLVVLVLGGFCMKLCLVFKGKKELSSED